MIQLYSAAERAGPAFRAAWDAFLTNTDRFFQGHSPRKFAMDLDRFIAAGGASRASAPGAETGTKYRGVVNPETGKRGLER